MGNRSMKTSCGSPSQGNQRAKNDGDPVAQSARESSSHKGPATAQALCGEVFVVYITQEANEVYILVPPEEMEGERAQENSQDSGETSSIAATAGSSGASSSGIWKEVHLAPELADSPAETMVRMDAPPIGLDLLGGACQLVLPEGSPKPSPETCKLCSSAELTSDSFVSEEEVAPGLASAVTLSAGMAEAGEGTKDLHPSAGLSSGTEVPESDQQLPCGVDLTLTMDNAPAEEQTTVQREFDEASSEEALQRMAELQPVFSETPGRDSIIMTAREETEQPAEGRTDPQNNLPLSVPEMEGEIPGGSWKERVPLCSPNEDSTETELQPTDQKFLCPMSLELTSENSQVAVEEPAIMPRPRGDEASPKKAVDTDLALVETSGGPSSMGVALGMKQPAEEQSIPGHDLPVAVTKMEGKVSGDCPMAENVGEITEVLSSQLKMLPAVAQDNILVPVELGDENACSVASTTPLEKELGHTLATQGFHTVEEKPDIDVQLFGGGAEFLDASRPDRASPASDTMVPES